MTWLLIGSSASVIEALPLAQDRAYPCDRTITANRGIKLWPCPSVFVCIDMYATRMLEREARAAQATGTRLVTLQRVPDAQRERRCDFYDEFLPSPAGPPTRAKWGEFKYSGPLCLEYACRNGATRVVLVGCDGYTGHGDYFDGYQQTKTPVEDVPQKWTRDVLQPGFEAVARCFPDVKMERIGRPVFTVNAANWSDTWLVQ